MQISLYNNPVTRTIIGSGIFGGIATAVGVIAAKVNNLSPMYGAVLGVQSAATFVLHRVVEEVAQKQDIAKHKVELLKAGVNALSITAATITLATLGILGSVGIGIAVASSALILSWNLANATYEYQKSRTG